MPRQRTARNRAPRVSVGVPVYNGERYLPRALDTILAQTYEDFEVILADNASTDTTPDIIRDYAARDSRIRHVRSDVNQGAAPNYNRTVALARGEYFRWNAHDDETHPHFLERCVEVLDNDPGVSLAHSMVRIIDDEGRTVEDYRYNPQTSAREPWKRFHDLLFVKNNCFEVFGLTRLDVFRQTGLHGHYPEGDRVLLAELAFRGRFYEVPERLFYSREHPNRSVRRHVTQHERAAWFDARQAGRIVFPEWRIFAEYWKAIDRAPLDARNRAFCRACMLKRARYYRHRMARDLLVALRQWLGSDPPI